MWLEAAFVLSTIVSMAESPSKVESLAWMSGHWVSRAGEDWTEELWSHPRAGKMLGILSFGRGDEAGSHEFIRIERTPEGIVNYWAVVADRQPRKLRMIAAEKNRAVFEDPTGTYPAIIRYERRNDILTVNLSDPRGGRPLRYIFRRSH